MAAYRNEAVPEEIERAAKKFRKRDAGIVRAEGEGASAHSRVIAGKWLPVLTEELAGDLKVRSNDEPALRTFFARIDKLDREKLALCLLLGALEGCGQKENLTKTAQLIGRNIHIECFGAGLFKGYPKAAANKLKKRFEKAPKRGRRQVEHELYKTGDWNAEALVRAGNWGIGQL